MKLNKIGYYDYIKIMSIRKQSLFVSNSTAYLYWTLLNY